MNYAADAWQRFSECRVDEKPTDSAGNGSSEDRIRARLRELTEATRHVRHELEELIRRPNHDQTRGMADDAREKHPPKKP